MKKEVNILEEAKSRTIVLADGNEYTFPAMDLITLGNLDENLGFGFDELEERMKTERFPTIQKLIYVLLLNHHPDMTLERAGRLVTMKQMPVITKIIEGLSQ